MADIYNQVYQSIPDDIYDGTLIRNVFQHVENSWDYLFIGFNKLNYIQCINSIVNSSNYILTNYEIAVLSKGLGYSPLQGLQTLVTLSKTWIPSKEE